MDLFQHVIHWMGGSLIQWACSIAVGLPFVVVAVRSANLRGRRVSLGGLIQLAVFFLISLALTRLDLVWTFIKSPWQAMILEACCALAFILAVGRGLPTERRWAGLTLHISPRAWRDSLVVTGLYLLFVGARSLLIGRLGIGGTRQAETAPVVLEYLLYPLCQIDCLLHLILLFFFYLFYLN